VGRGKSVRPTVVPGKPSASELIARVTSRDPDVRMPLHAPSLSGRQIDLLSKWIREGAEWEDHWGVRSTEASTTSVCESSAMDWATARSIRSLPDRAGGTADHELPRDYPQFCNDMELLRCSAQRVYL
jgi:hypothetical protein